MFPSIISVLLEAVSGVFFLAGYVTNTNSFPPAMSPEEEIKYFELYRRGEDDAKNILVERNLRLVGYLVGKRYGIMRNDYEDLISAGSIGLIKAVSTFDHKRNIRFATYAAKCIDNEIKMYIRANSKTDGCISLDGAIDTDSEGNETALMDLIGTEPDVVVKQVETNIITRWIFEKVETVLKKNEKTIIKLRFGIPGGNTKTQLEIAKMLGISRSYVSRIETKAIKKLSEALDGHNCL